MNSLQQTQHRPWPMPQRPWRLRQRWSKLLFAHWPMPAQAVQAKLPTGLRVDIHDGWAWLGVVPFLMDQVRFRTIGERCASVPSATAFPELNLRTYIVAPDGRPGVYFFSLDAGSLLAVLGARVAFGLPYFWSRMHMQQEDGWLRYISRRRLGTPVDFSARYRSLGTPSPQDSLRHFLTERYAFFIRRFGRVQAGEIHHAPWTLENAEAEFERNDLPRSFGFKLPDCPPVLHYAPEVHMQAWTVRASSRSSREPLIEFVFGRAQLQLCHKLLRINPALATEGSFLEEKNLTRVFLDQSSTLLSV